MLYFHVVLYRGLAIEGDLDPVIVDLIALTTMKYRRFKSMWLKHNLHQSVLFGNHCCATCKTIQQWAPELDPFLTALTMIGDGDQDTQFTVVKSVTRVSLSVQIICKLYKK